MGQERTSYKALSRLPAYGLYQGDELLASVRARNAWDARRLFREHHARLRIEGGDKVRLIQRHD